MTFGNKLYKLRKEKGLSQEALAEKLNTSRQAISKWENDQGFPETEKMIMIGNIFAVSMDYLFKENVQVHSEKEEGFYVSKELGEGYLIHQRRMGKYLSIGLLLIALSVVPYFLFNKDPSLFLIPTIILATIGLIIAISTSLIEENRYKILKQEPLLFDQKYLQELTERYGRVKKSYGIVMLFGICLFVAGMIAFGIERKYMTTPHLEAYYPLLIGFIAIGIGILTYTSSVMDAYKLLVHNEDYVNKLSFKIRNKLRRKIDDF